jgi:hypothetical protein
VDEIARLTTENERLSELYDLPITEIRLENERLTTENAIYVDHLRQHDKEMDVLRDGFKKLSMKNERLDAIITRAQQLPGGETIIQFAEYETSEEYMKLAYGKNVMSPVTLNPGNYPECDVCHSKGANGCLDVSCELDKKYTPPSTSNADPEPIEKKNWRIDCSNYDIGTNACILGRDVKDCGKYEDDCEAPVEECIHRNEKEEIWCDLYGECRDDPCEKYEPKDTSETEE